jgi:hypothetical protein
MSATLVSSFSKLGGGWKKFDAHHTISRSEIYIDPRQPVSLYSVPPKVANKNILTGKPSSSTTHIVGVVYWLKKSSGGVHQDGRI